MGNLDEFERILRRCQLPPDEELKLFKGVVRNIVHDAARVLAELELEVSGPEAERLTALLDHYLSYTERFCNDDFD